VHDNPNKWAKWLSQAEFWYNTSLHSAHGRTPFEVLYGRKPRPFGYLEHDQTGNRELDEWLQERARMIPEIQHHLARAQQRMKAQADKNRSERQFDVGDWVYLKLQPYVQHTVARRPCQKLGFKFFGPFKILKRVGNVSYKLDLPESARIHPVIHVSQLKKAVKPGAVVSKNLPAALLSDDIAVQPQRIIGERAIKQGNKQVSQLLIQWEGWPEECSTWENVFVVVNAFPHAPAWGQAGTRGGGIVTTQYLPEALRAKLRTDERQKIREAHVRRQAQLTAREPETSIADTLLM
jgi:hypothetical protein